MWLVPRKVYSISVDPLDDLTGCFTAIWKRFLTLESFPEFSSQYVSLGNVKMIVSLPWDCLQHNKPLSINNRIKRGNRERHGSDVHICRFEALSHAAGGGREVKKVKNQAPGAEGQGGWGSQTRSLEWWRSLTSVCVHAAREDSQKVCVSISDHIHRLIIVLIKQTRQTVSLEMLADRITEKPYSTVAVEKTNNNPF